eukprot:scaffold2052_cov60-Phaeocystis_antarctica.AAC.2
MSAVTLHGTSINSARYTLHPQTFATKVERARDGEARVQRQTCAQAQRGVKSVPKAHAGGSGLFHLALLSCMSCPSSFNLEKAVKFQQGVKTRGPFHVIPAAGAHLSPPRWNSARLAASGRYTAFALIRLIAIPRPLLCTSNTLNGKFEPRQRYFDRESASSDLDGASIHLDGASSDCYTEGTRRAAPTSSTRRQPRSAASVSGPTAPRRACLRHTCLRTPACAAPACAAPACAMPAMPPSRRTSYPHA